MSYMNDEEIQKFLQKLKKQIYTGNVNVILIKKYCRNEEDRSLIAVELKNQLFFLKQEIENLLVLNYNELNFLVDPLLKQTVSNQEINIVRKLRAITEILQIIFDYLISINYTVELLANKTIISTAFKSLLNKTLELENTLISAPIHLNDFYTQINSLITDLLPIVNNLLYPESINVANFIAIIQKTVSTKKSKVSKSMKEEVLSRNILEIIKENPNIKTKEIYEKLRDKLNFSIASTEVKKIVNQLKKEGKIKGNDRDGYVIA